MFSKLKFSGGSSQAACLSSNLLDLLPDLFGSSIKGARCISGGKSSLAFTAEVDGRRRFLKTILNKGASARLLKEAKVLITLYQKDLDPEIVETSLNGDTRVWLLMNEVEPNRSTLDPSQVRKLISETQSRISYELSSDILSVEDSFEWLLGAALEGLRSLNDVNHVGSDTHERVLNYLTVGIRNIQSNERVFAHGDLGPKNILRGSRGLMLLDWEDCFAAPPDYDFLYWATFFENRKCLLSGEVFTRTDIDKTGALSLILMILVLKGWLSLRNGEYRYHSLPIHQRIEEALSLAV